MIVKGMRSKSVNDMPTFIKYRKKFCIGENNLNDVISIFEPIDDTFSAIALNVEELTLLQALVRMT